MPLTLLSGRNFEAGPQVSQAGLSVLYVGASDGTSLDRAHALRRLGHRVDHLDLRKLFKRTRLTAAIVSHLGGHLFSPWVLRALSKSLEGKRYEICVVDGGEMVTPKAIELIRRHAKKIANYNIDDPLGPRDGAKSAAYRQSVAFYDLCIVMRPINVSEARSLGAKHVIQKNRAADEITHAPRLISDLDREKWSSDVLFLGTWFPERGPFLRQLVVLGVPLTIRGPNWHKAPEWRALQPHWKGGAIAGDDYAKAIQCAKINLGLLSKGNRDLHTTRSLEIPALGGLFCAERTSEHLDMYVEGREALYWDSVEECAEVCKNALRNEDLRAQIAAAGHARYLRDGNQNERLMASIIAELQRV
jgi:spore maturation protein CgeB